VPLTPSDVANKQFGRQVRGYAMEEVDSFLDEVEQELSRLLTENARIAQRAAAAPAATPVASTPVAPTAAPPAAPPPEAAAETQEAALRTLLMAQRTADQAVAEAKAGALANAIEREPIKFGDWSAPLHISYGVRQISAELEPETLVSQADAAMFASKRLRGVG
jgi:DivIVA domain-containing protein